MLKEAALQSLKELNRPVCYITVYEYIVNNKYYGFYNAKTPEHSVSAALGELYKQGNPHIKRTKTDARSFLYEYV